MTNSIKRFLLLFSVLSFGFHAVAQQQLKGSLVDAAESKPIVYCNCVLLKSTDSSFVSGTTTDDKGRFAFKQVAKGDYLLRITYVGYEYLWLPVSLNGSSAPVDLGTLSLKRASTMLNAVTVSAAKPLYAVDGEKNMYNTTEDPSVQNGTASDALQNAPGVEVDAEGNITLRGVSSVEIWINDRPSHMNEEALKQYIKQLPANAIDHIEVITNPSARYSTTGGVINIVTTQKIKRNELLCVGVRGNTMPSLSPWVSYVYANEKFDMNIYLNGNFGVHNMYSDATNTLLDSNGDTSRYQDGKTETRSKNYGGYSGLNFNWKISDKTQLATWMGVYPYWGNNSTEMDLIYREYQPTLRHLGYNYQLDNPDGFGWGGYMGAWLEHRFDTTGRKLSVSLNGNTWNEHGIGTETFTYDDPTLSNLMRRTEKRNTSPSGSMEVNYTHPLKHDITLEAGAELELGGGTQYLGLDTLAADGYHPVALRVSDGMERGTGLNGYVTLQKRWGGFTAKLGLRAEQRWKRSEWSHLDGAGMTVVDTAFFGLVPSIHLSYQSPTFTSYSLSYTLRNTTPGMTQLSPFRRYEDYSFETGNPNLLRSYTHNLEAAWSKYIMGFGMLNLSAYFRANTDEIGTMPYAGYAPEYFGSQMVNYTRPENIGSSHTEGLQANITYRPTAFFNIRLNASVWNYAYEYNGFSDSKVSFSARINLWAKLWNKLEVFANAHYRSSSIALYSETVPNRGVDFGVSSDFFERRMSVYLNVNDIFGMAQWGENTTAPQYQTTGKQRFDSRFISLGLTWRFGKMELESKARQGATDMPMGGAN